MPAGNHGSCIHDLGLDICFDDFSYHDSLQARLINTYSLKKSIAEFIFSSNRKYNNQLYVIEFYAFKMRVKIPMQEKTSIYFPEELSLKKLHSVQEIMRSKDA